MMDEQAAAVLDLVETTFKSPARFILNTGSKPFTNGRQSIVYALEVEDTSKRICVRILREPHSPAVKWLFEREVEIRQLINAAQIRLFQPLLAFDTSADNALQNAYMILSWAEGGSMEWSDVVPADQTTRRNIMHTIANATLDLVKIHRSGEMALEWMTTKIARKIARAQAGTYIGSVAECEQQKDLIPKYWIPDLDAAPHVLVHGDLVENNIIVNDEGAVQSIIDLGFADFRPLQFAAEFPRFLLHEPNENEDGSFTWAQQDSEIMREDRAF